MVEKQSGASLGSLCSMGQLYLNRKGAYYCTTFLVICSFSFITSSLLLLGREFWREAWHIRKMWKQSTVCKNNKGSHEQWTQSKQQKCQHCWDWLSEEPGRQVTTSTTVITLPPVYATAEIKRVSSGLELPTQPLTLGSAEEVGAIKGFRVLFSESKEEKFSVNDTVNWWPLMTSTTDAHRQ